MRLRRRAGTPSKLDVDSRGSGLKKLSVSPSSKECGRGAVTCGDHWIFFAYQAPKGSDYAKYARTEVLDLGKDAENADLILGILIDWVRSTQFVNLVMSER